MSPHPEPGRRTPHIGKRRHSVEWIVSTGLFVVLVALSACRSSEDPAAAAIRDFERGAYEAAASGFAAALSAERPGSPEEILLRYDLGTSYYKLNQFRDATAQLLQAAERATREPVGLSDRFRASAYYNLGNAFFRERDYGRAAEAYRAALRLRPDDRDAKHNLELALDELERSAAGGAPDDSTEAPTPTPGEGPEEPLPQTPAGLSEAEARRLLEMLGGDEAQQQQQRVRNMLPPRYDVEKDW